MFWPFKKRYVTDETIFKVLGNQIRIRNGMGYGFVSDPHLYNNQLLEIGIGRVVSGYGDWGYGCDRATDSPLKITIDRNYNILKTQAYCFYNSAQRYKEMEKMADKLIPKLGPVFLVRNSTFKKCIDEIFSVIPCDWHIGLDVCITNKFSVEKMMNHFVYSRK